MIDTVPDDGSDASPLERAIERLGGTGPKTLLLRGGIHRLRHSLTLAHVSDAVTIRPCPGTAPVIAGPQGAPSLILQESRHVSIIGLTFAGQPSVHLLLDRTSECLLEGNTFIGGTEAILLDHAGHNRIERNTIVDAAMTGIEMKDESNGNLVADNLVDGAAAPETAGGGIFLHGADDNRITHNVVQNTNGFGIGVLNWDDATINAGNIVEYNLLARTALEADDSGAIYVLGRSGIDTGMVIANNVVIEVGRSGRNNVGRPGRNNDGRPGRNNDGRPGRNTDGTPGRHNVGIYLDDSTSGALVVRNLVRNPGSDAIQIHGGSDNLIENNILDLGPGRPSAVLFQAAPADTHPLNLQTGNIVTHNVIVSPNPSTRPFVWYAGGQPTVSDNLYALPGGIAPTFDPPVADAQPHLTDRQPAPSDRNRYTDLMAAAAAIGIHPIDPAAAGLRP